LFIFPTRFVAQRFYVILCLLYIAKLNSSPIFLNFFGQKQLLIYLVFKLQPKYIRGCIRARGNFGKGGDALKKTNRGGRGKSKGKKIRSPPILRPTTQWLRVVRNLCDAVDAAAVAHEAHCLSDFGSPRGNNNGTQQLQSSANKEGARSPRDCKEAPSTLRCTSGKRANAFLRSNDSSSCYTSCDSEDCLNEQHSALRLDSFSQWEETPKLHARVLPAILGLSPTSNGG